jgi:hypothetical protein
MTYAKKIVTSLPLAEAAGRWFKRHHVTSETEPITANVERAVFCGLSAPPGLDRYLLPSRVMGLGR